MIDLASLDPRRAAGVDARLFNPMSRPLIGGQPRKQSCRSTQLGARSQRRIPWNGGRLIGQQRPFTPKDVWSIQVRLEILGSKRDLALFSLAIDSKLLGCDPVARRVGDVHIGGRARERMTIVRVIVHIPLVQAAA